MNRGIRHFARNFIEAAFFSISAEESLTAPVFLVIVRRLRKNASIRVS